MVNDRKLRVRFQVGNNSDRIESFPADYLTSIGEDGLSVSQVTEVDGAKRYVSVLFVPRSRLICYERDPING